MSPTLLAKILNFPELPDYFEQVERRMIALASDLNPIIKQAVVSHIDGINERLSIFFVLSVVKSQGGIINESVINGCAALEFLKIALYIHDDVTDHSNLRYGKPTINATLGVNQAILIGDYVLNLATEEALAVGPEIADVFISSIAENREAEIIEEADRHNLDRTIDSYINCIRLKTSFFPATCEIGGLHTTLGKSQVRSLAKYGESVGIMVQAIDDLLDFVSTKEILGKPVGKDVEEGIYTLPLLLALKSPYLKQVVNLLKTKTMPGDQAAFTQLLKILVVSGAFEKTVQTIRSYNDQAVRALKGLEGNEVLRGLLKFPTYNLDIQLELHADRLSMH